MNTKFTPKIESFSDKKNVNAWYVQKYTRQFLWFKWIRKVDFFEIHHDLLKDMELRKAEGASEPELMQWRGMILALI